MSGRKNLMSCRKIAWTKFRLSLDVLILGRTDAAGCAVCRWQICHRQNPGEGRAARFCSGQNRMRPNGAGARDATAREPYSGGDNLRMPQHLTPQR